MRSRWSVNVKRDDCVSAAVPSAGGSGGGAESCELEEITCVAGAEMSQACLVRAPIRWSWRSHSIGLKTEYNAPSHHALEGAISWSHPCFSTTSLCSFSCGFS